MTSNARDHGTTKDDTLHAEAASWFVRMHMREPSTAEVADWQHWLTADQAHRHAFARFEDLWQTIGETELHFRVQNRPHAVASVAAPSSAARRRWPLALAATVLVAVIGTGLFLSRSIRLPQLPASAAVETRTAEDRTYVLADGSRVDVGARTRVVVDFSDQTRNVIIDAGEAYFEVAHEARPFVVRAGSGTITAVGTAFNVHHIQGRVAVAVVEGTVKVHEFADDAVSAVPEVSAVPAPGSLLPTVVVRAGEGVVYGRAAKPVEALDIRVATAWRDGHLKFLREPLGYVAADVERYTDIHISIADPAVAELLYTGTVIPDEINDWLALLAHAFPIEVQRIGGRAVLLKLRAEARDPPEAIEQ